MTPSSRVDIAVQMVAISHFVTTSARTATRKWRTWSAQEAALDARLSAGSTFFPQRLAWHRWREASAQQHVELISRAGAWRAITEFVIYRPLRAAMRRLHRVARFSRAAQTAAILGSGRRRAAMCQALGRWTALTGADLAVARGAQHGVAVRLRTAHGRWRQWAASRAPRRPLRRYGQAVVVVGRLWRTWRQRALRWTGVGARSRRLRLLHVLCRWHDAASEQWWLHTASRHRGMDWRLRMSVRRWSRYAHAGGEAAGAFRACMLEYARCAALEAWREAVTRVSWTQVSIAVAHRALEAHCLLRGWSAVRAVSTRGALLGAAESRRRRVRLKEGMGALRAADDEPRRLADCAWAHRSLRLRVRALAAWRVRATEVAAAAEAIEEQQAVAARASGLRRLCSRWASWCEWRTRCIDALAAASLRASCRRWRREVTARITTQTTLCRQSASLITIGNARGTRRALRRWLHLLMVLRHERRTLHRWRCGVHERHANAERDAAMASIGRTARARWALRSWQDAQLAALLSSAARGTHARPSAERTRGANATRLAGCMRHWRHRLEWQSMRAHKTAKLHSRARGAVRRLRLGRALVRWARRHWFCHRLPRVLSRRLALVSGLGAWGAWADRSAAEEAALVRAAGAWHARAALLRALRGLAQNYVVCRGRQAVAASQARLARQATLLEAADRWRRALVCFAFRRRLSARAHQRWRLRRWAVIARETKADRRDAATLATWQQRRSLEHWRRYTAPPSRYQRLLQPLRRMSAPNAARRASLGAVQKSTPARCAHPARRSTEPRDSGRGSDGRGRRAPPWLPP